MLLCETPKARNITVVEIVWELSITIYTIVKGFRQSPVVDGYIQARALTEE